MTLVANSTPSFSDFDPTIIAYQDQVIDDVVAQFDYSLGVHEFLLSGAVGCLREDALIQTASGEVRIGDIKSGQHLLSLRGPDNQFVWQLSSGAFPKGKGTLYRVVHEHGEFVGAGNHLVATSYGTYLPILSLSAGQSLLAPGKVPLSKSPCLPRSSSLEGVLRCWQTLASFWGHCVERIRQCDPQLLQAANTCLAAIPLQADAQVFGQFSYSRIPEQTGDPLAQAQALARTFESLAPQSMLHSLRLLRSGILDGEGACIPGGSKLCERTLSDTLKQMLCQTHDVHPKALLFALSELCSLVAKLTPVVNSPTNIPYSAIKSIERVGEEWYWDLQVPNTNNYVSTCGAVHHNSAKSVLLAHLALRHLLTFPRSRGAFVRKSMPDLKATIFRKLTEHMDGALEEGTHYWVNHTTGTINFKNGSQLICRSWSDRQYMKLRSLELSFAVVEEITENDEEDKRGYIELKLRVGRLPHVKENWIGAACNPDSPSHWVYEYFELLKDEGLGSNAPLGSGPLADRKPTKHVYYSTTDDNPFLPQSYRDQLRTDLDPKMYLRMGKGRWVEVSSDGVYHQYDRSQNYIDAHYEIDTALPVILTWDFNIGEGKPLSVAVCQYRPSDDTFHVGFEVVIEGMRTEDSCEELAGRGLLDFPTDYIVCGDATGKHKDTRSRRSDYEIIVDFLSNYKSRHGGQVAFQKLVPLANPPVRDRHNLVNAYLCNAEGRRRLFVYKDAPTVDKGLRLTRLLDSGRYIEDDSKPYQHVTTSIGYAVNAVKTYLKRQPQRTIQL